MLGHEPMGIVEAVGSAVTNIAAGDRVVIPFNISCGHCWMCDHGLQSQCETTQVREQGMGASLFGYTKLYGQVPGGQAEFLRVPQAQYGPIKVPEGPPDDRFLFLSDVLPTAWQAVEYAQIPEGGSVAVIGLGPIGEMATRIAQHLGAGLVIGIDLVPERLARAQATACRRSTSAVEESPRRFASLTGGRGADSVIDAVGMEAHGSPGGKLAHTLAGLMPDASREGDGERRRRPPRRAQPGRGGRPPRRHDLAVRRLRRHRRPAEHAADVRQAAHAAAWARPT